MKQKIRLVAIDQDGTLLDSEGRLSARNRGAIQRAVAQGVIVILATGKSATSARELLPQLGLPLSGVFSQGLVLYEGGRVLREIGLSAETAVSTITFAETHQLPLLAYCGERMLASFASPHSDLLHSHFKEPAADIVGSLRPWVGQIVMNKLLIGVDETNSAATRRALEASVAAGAEVVQAVPPFLEVLPQHTSKGEGLAYLLNHWHIAPEAVLAIGDGENDLEMLQMVGLGVAMGNGITAVQAVADAVVASNNEDGVAEALEQFVLH